MQGMTKSKADKQKGRRTAEEKPPFEVDMVWVELCLCDFLFPQGSGVGSWPA